MLALQAVRQPGAARSQQIRVPIECGCEYCVVRCCCLYCRDGRCRSVAARMACEPGQHRCRVAGHRGDRHRHGIPELPLALGLVRQRGRGAWRVAADPRRTRARWQARFHLATGHQPAAGGPNGRLARRLAGELWRGRIPGRRAGKARWVHHAHAARQGRRAERRLGPAPHGPTGAMAVVPEPICGRIAPARGAGHLRAAAFDRFRRRAENSGEQPEPQPPEAQATATGARICRPSSADATPSRRPSLPA
jgi:hypothetical protein